MPINLMGGVENYCDPKRLNTIQFSCNPYEMVGVGIHPTLANRASDRALDTLETPICVSRMSAMSELGLDHSLPQAAWARQEQLLEHILKMGVAGRALVIHTQGKHADSVLHRF